MLLFDLLGQLTPSNLTAYVVNAHTLSVSWDLPSNVNSIDRIYLTVKEMESNNRTIQSQSFDNTIKKLDLQINGNDPYSRNSFFSFIEQMEFHSCQVYIQIERYFSLLEHRIVMDKIHRLLNTNSLSICIVSGDCSSFSFFLSLASYQTLGKDSIQKRHLLVCFAARHVDRIRSSW